MLSRGRPPKTIQRQPTRSKEEPAPRIKRSERLFDEGEEGGGGRTGPHGANDALEFALSKPSRVPRGRAGTVGKQSSHKPTYRLEDHLDDSDDADEGQEGYAPQKEEQK